MKDSSKLLLGRAPARALGREGDALRSRAYHCCVQTRYLMAQQWPFGEAPVHVPPFLWLGPGLALVPFQGLSTGGAGVVFDFPRVQCWYDFSFQCLCAQCPWGGEGEKSGV